METWMQGKLAVIIGHPWSVFTQRLAAFWRKQGLEVAIVTRHWGGKAQTDDGTKILQSFDAEGRSLRERLSSLHELWLHKRWLRVERDVNDLECLRYSHAMGAKELRDYHPSFADSLVNAVSIPPFVAQLDPAFVFGQEIFTYGLATALCAVSPKVLMPWGGDVRRFADTSSVAFAMVQRALQKADLVVPSGVAEARYLVRRFGLPIDKVHSALWGIDRRKFRKATKEQRRAFCAQRAIDQSSIIIVNVRKFKPYWGSDIAIETFLRLAVEDPRLQFFSIGGPDAAPFISEARKRISAKGLEHRITILDGHIPDRAVQELFSVADIFTSLCPRRFSDLRSSSILEGAAVGATPVLTDIDEYREMERLGFRALFIEKEDASATMAAVRRAIDDPALRADIAAANARYLEKHEDEERNMLGLLDLIARLPVHSTERAPSIPATLKEINDIIAACGIQRRDFLYDLDIAVTELTKVVQLPFVQIPKLVHYLWPQRSVSSD